MFKGDIVQFSPADLFAFLGHLDKEGILTVSRGEQSLTVGVRAGTIVEASSDQADEEVLAAIHRKGLISNLQYQELSAARRETNLPVRHLVEEAEALPLADVVPVLGDGVFAVLFELFTWDSGHFQFAEVPIAQGDAEVGIPCQAAVLETTRRVDEHLERMRTTESANTVDATADPPPSEAPHDELSASYKRSLRRVLAHTTKRKQIAEIVHFARTHFNYVLVLASKGDRVERCMRFAYNDSGTVERADIRTEHPLLKDDPVLGWAHRAGLTFVGETQASPLLVSLGEEPPEGECAVVPLGLNDELDVMIYTAGAHSDAVPGPYYFLELLSWQLLPPKDGGEVDGGQAVAAAARSDAVASPPEPTDNDRALRRMVSRIRELPPMPAAVSRIFGLLADANSSISDLTDALSLDPALVARLIKVSNSALYGRGQQTSTLNQAIVRLGTKTIRSIVLAASTRSIFPTSESSVGMWAQALWHHSIECGLASRRVAEHVPEVDPEEAFVGGVLHDIGKLVILLNLPGEYQKIQSVRASQQISDLEAERDVLGFDHTQVGELLLEKWQMPEGLWTCVRYHHRPDEPESEQALAGVVACGNYFSHLYGSQPDPARAEQAADIDALAIELGISPVDLQTLRDTIPEDIGASTMLV